MNQLITLGLLLILAAAIGEACDCPPTHPQEEFCNADFVIKALILGRKEEGEEEKKPPMENVEEEMAWPSIQGDYEYSIKITAVYKNKRTGRRYATLDKLYSPISSSMCGLKLTIGEKYIILGSLSGLDNKAHINACSLIRKWSSMKKAERQKLREYKKACNVCEVQSNCFAWCKKKENACQYNPMQFEADYCLENQVCTMNEDGKCQFENEKCARPEVEEKEEIPEKFTHEEFVFPSAKVEEKEEAENEVMKELEAAKEEVEKEESEEGKADEESVEGESEEEAGEGKAVEEEVEEEEALEMVAEEEEALAVVAEEEEALEMVAEEEEALAVVAEEEEAEEEEAEKGEAETEAKKPAEEVKPAKPAEEMKPAKPAEEMKPAKPAEEMNPEKPAEEKKPEEAKTTKLAKEVRP
ncbi:myristoylated alanine-rich C-kinase substrate-like [Lineus longissimus]|uniref:myristoylated alanine-rich C-kinase substrate-like n=1 Tax=Lineus longissimus TaxID=88925 RepID=UPI002B4CB471